MRLVRIGLVALLVLIQWPLWFGEGGWLKAWERERQLAAQRQAVDQLKQRNASLDAEVRDLRDGTAAIEERARSELGMIKANEVFVQILQPGAATAPPAASTTPAAVPALPAATAPASAPTSHGP